MRINKLYGAPLVAWLLFSLLLCPALATAQQGGRASRDHLTPRR